MPVHRKRIDAALTARVRELLDQGLTREVIAQRCDLSLGAVSRARRAWTADTARSADAAPPADDETRTS